MFSDFWTFIKLIWYVFVIIAYLSTNFIWVIRFIKIFNCMSFAFEHWYKCSISIRYTCLYNKNQWPFKLLPFTLWCFGLLLWELSLPLSLSSLGFTLLYPLTISHSPFCLNFCIQNSDLSSVRKSSLNQICFSNLAVSNSSLSYFPL